MEEFLLKWNDHHASFFTIVEELCRTEQLCDVTLACGGQVFETHKLILSVCSPYFRTLLNSRPDKHPIVYLKDVNPKHLEQLLSYMYRGEINVLQDDLGPLIETARGLQIKGLADAGGTQPDADKPSTPAKKISTGSSTSNSRIPGQHAAAAAAANGLAAVPTQPLNPTGNGKRRQTTTSLLMAAAQAQMQFAKVPKLDTAPQSSLQPSELAVFNNNDTEEEDEDNRDGEMVIEDKNSSDDGNLVVKQEAIEDKEERSWPIVQSEVSGGAVLESDLQAEDEQYIQPEAITEQQDRISPEALKPLSTMSGVEAEADSLGDLTDLEEADLKPGLNLPPSISLTPTNNVDSEDNRLFSPLGYSSPGVSPPHLTDPLAAHNDLDPPAMTFGRAGWSAKCTKCDLEFQAPSLYERHMRTHTQERPYKCDICGNSYSQSGNLNVHLKTIHGLFTGASTPPISHQGNPYESWLGSGGAGSGSGAAAGSTPTLGLDRYKQSLRALTSSGGGQHAYQHKCSICQRSFTTASNLYQHIRMVHNMMVETGKGNKASISLLKMGGDLGKASRLTGSKSPLSSTSGLHIPPTSTVKSSAASFTPPALKRGGSAGGHPARLEPWAKHHLNQLKTLANVGGQEAASDVPPQVPQSVPSATKQKPSPAESVRRMEATIQDTLQQLSQLAGGGAKEATAGQDPLQQLGQIAGGSSSAKESNSPDAPLRLSQFSKEKSGSDALQQLSQLARGNSDSSKSGQDALQQLSQMARSSSVGSNSGQDALQQLSQLATGGVAPFKSCLNARRESANSSIGSTGSVSGAEKVYGKVESEEIKIKEEKIS